MDLEEYAFGEIDHDLHAMNRLASEVAGLYVTYRVTQKCAGNTEAGTIARYRWKERERECLKELNESAHGWLRAFVGAGE